MVIFFLSSIVFLSGKKVFGVFAGSPSWVTPGLPSFDVFGHGQMWMPPEMWSQWLVLQNQGFYGHDPYQFMLYEHTIADSCREHCEDAKNKFYMPLADRTGTVHDIDLSLVRARTPSSPPRERQGQGSVRQEPETPVQQPEPPVSEPEPEPETPVQQPEPPVSEPEPEPETPVQQPEPPVSEPEPEPETPVQQPEPPVSEPEPEPETPVQQPEPPVSEPESEVAGVCDEGYKPDDTTEAGTDCMQCMVQLESAITGHNEIGISISDVNTFLPVVDREVASYREAKGDNPYKDLMINFCNECGDATISEFTKYMRERSKDLNIPMEILMALGLRESVGMCSSGPGRDCTRNSGEVCKNGVPEYNCTRARDEDGSFGFYQLNLKNSCEFRVSRMCKEGWKKFSDELLKRACPKYPAYGESVISQIGCIKPSGSNAFDLQQCRKYYGGPRNKKPGTCLNNPYCSLEEAITLLNRKWFGKGFANNGSKPEIKSNGKPQSWTEMSREDRDKWRNAILAYNGYHVGKDVENYIEAKRGDGTLTDDLAPMQLKGWELKRQLVLTSVIYNQGNQQRKKQDVIQTADDQKLYMRGGVNIVENLAFMERITGREKDSGMHDSGICQWVNSPYAKDPNRTPTCEELKESTVSTSSPTPI